MLPLRGKFSLVNLAILFLWELLWEDISNKQEGEGEGEERDGGVEVGVVTLKFAGVGVRML